MSKRAAQIEIRAPRPADAPALLRFGELVFAETAGFIRGPGERAADVAEMRAVIEGFRDTDGYCLLNAWEGNEPVGEVTLVRGQYRRTRSTAAVGIGVLKRFWGRGVGLALMRRVEEEARAWDLHRLELTVFASNPKAIAFYERLDYRREGIKRDAVMIDGEYVDEIMMAKLLDGRIK